MAGSDLDELAELDRKLAQFIATMLDLRPFWPMVVPLFIGWMREQFDTEGAFAGAAWAELSPAYAAWKSSAYPGKGILVATGALKHFASDPDRTVGPDSLILTIIDPKLEYHQTGTMNMPARPLLFEQLPPSAEAELYAAQERYVDEMATAIGL